MEIPFNLLLLPFLGGYIFVRFWNYTRIHVLRSDKDRLIIRASLIGLISIFITYFAKIFLSPIFPCGNFAFCIPEWWGKNVPFEYSGISVAAFLIAATVWYPLNFYFTQEREINRAIEEDADPLELLLKRAQDGNVAVSITTTSGKIYVGFITHTFNPATPTSNIGILPLQSGFRDSETKRMNLTTNYSQAYEQITNEIDEISNNINELEEKRAGILSKNSSAKSKDVDSKIEKLAEEWGKLKSITNLFELIVPVNQIASINYFDKEVHTKYFPYEKENIIITNESN